MLASRRALAPVIDENKARRVIAKASFGGHEATKEVASKNGHRRVLGDIGNIGPAVPALKRVAEDNRRITRAAAKLAEAAARERPPKVPTREKVSIPRRRSLTAQLTSQVQVVDVKDVNIDEVDKGNPLAVADYVEDIYSFYRKSESTFSPHDYLASQTDINEKMRLILVSWLIQVHGDFRLMEETLYLTINILDRYLSKVEVRRKQLQTVGLAALFIASKYEEITPPSVKHLEHISDGSCKEEEILKVETSILNTLNFNLTVPTPFVFIIRYLKAASADRELYVLAFYLLELSLLDYSMIKYKPSKMAASAVFTGRCFLKKSPVWSRTLERHTGYAETQLSDCARLMASLYRKAGPKEKETVPVFNKYNNNPNVTAMNPNCPVLD